jgi:hypothetical protein
MGFFFMDDVRLCGVAPAVGYYVMVELGRRGKPRVFLSSSGDSLGIGEGEGKHFPREFPEWGLWDGGKERAVPEEGRPGRVEPVEGFLRGVRVRDYWG